MRSLINRPTAAGLAAGAPVLVVVLLLLSVRVGTAADASRNFPYPGTQQVHRLAFTAFDTETTGFDPGRDRVIEVGAVRFTLSGEMVTTNWLINPHRRIPRYLSTVHGITDEMVRDAPVFKEIYPRFLQFSKGTLLIAHNAGFDVRFINAEIRRTATPSPSLPVLDTLRIFRAWYPASPSHSLPSLVKWLRLTHGRFHRATDDALYLARIFRRHYAGRSESLQDLLSDAGGRALWISP